MVDQDNVLIPEKKDEEESVHYVCSGGCGAESKQQRKCVSPGCPRSRNLFTKCTCTDGKHKDVRNLNNPNYVPDEEEE